MLSKTAFLSRLGLGLIIVFVTPSNVWAWDNYGRLDSNIPAYNAPSLNIPSSTIDLSAANSKIYYPPIDDLSFREVFLPFDISLLDGRELESSVVRGLLTLEELAVINKALAGIREKDIPLDIRVRPDSIVSTRSGKVEFDKDGQVSSAALYYNEEEWRSFAPLGLRMRGRTTWKNSPTPQIDDAGISGLGTVFTRDLLRVLTEGVVVEKFKKDTDDLNVAYEEAQWVVDLVLSRYQGNKEQGDELFSKEEPEVVSKQDAAVYKFFQDGFKDRAETKPVQKRGRERVIRASGQAPVPAQFTVNATSDGVVNVTCNAVEGVMYYELQENTVNDFTNPLAAYYPTTGDKGISNRATGTYYYRIRTWMPNEAEPSAWSEVISVEVRVAQTADKSIEALKLDLDSADVDVQIAAAKELYARGDTGGISLAREKLVWPRISTLTMANPVTAHYSASFKELEELEQICIQPLRDNLYNADAETDTRKWSVHLLGHIGRFEEVFSEIIAVAEGPYAWWIQAEARYGLDPLLSRQAKEKLIALLKYSQSDVRGEAVRVFGRISKQGDVLVEDALIERLNNDSGADVRWATAQVLGRMGSEKAVVPFIKALNDTYYSVRRVAAEALGDFGDVRAVEALIAALQDDDIWVRRYSAQALGKIGDARAVEPLIEALKDKDSWVRRYAAEALGKIGGTRAIEGLIIALEDIDSDVRKASASELPRI